MLRLRFNFLLILIIIFSYAVEELTVLQEEVVDTSKFSEYYSLGDGENQGEQILTSNYFVFHREYQINEKGELVRKSEEEGVEEVVTEVPIEEAAVVEITEYTVKKGDTLSVIAKSFKIDEEIIKINNPKNKKIIKPGDKLRITSENGILYKIKKGDSLFKIATRYKVKIDDLRKYNKLESDSLVVDEEIFIKNPDLRTLRSELIVVREKKTPVSFEKGVEGFIMPIAYQGVNSSYGNRFHPILRRYIMHAGVDLKARYIPFKASNDGIVSYTGYMSGYGKIVIVKHDKGYETRYAHIQEAWVKVGERVSQGQTIGKTGNSGRSSGPHLHFEMRKNGRTIDPMRNVIR